MKARFSGASSTTTTVLVGALEASTCATVFASIGLPSKKSSSGEEAIAHRPPCGIGRAANLVHQLPDLVAAAGLACGLEATGQSLHAADAGIARGADQVVRLARERREVGPPRHRLDAPEPADRAVEIALDQRTEVVGRERDG